MIDQLSSTNTNIWLKTKEDLRLVKFVARIFQVRNNMSF